VRYDRALYPKYVATGSVPVGARFEKPPSHLVGLEKRRVKRSAEGFPEEFNNVVEPLGSDLLQLQIHRTDYSPE